MTSKKGLIKIKKQVFSDFQVYSLNSKYSFFHINLLKDSFYDDLFDYFFCEEKLLKYAENKSNLNFTANLVNYTTLYRMLEYFIDSENLKMDISGFNDEIKEVLKNENKHEYNKIGNLILRLDKIGEYIFTSILWEYFQFDCIIPKVHLSTDPNMSVYGIDTVFYSSDQETLLFGESKLSKDLKNGVKLIKESLKEYERQIEDEYKLVLTNRIYKNCLNVFNDKYGSTSERCVDIYEFIKEAKIKKIGIPIFIAHGEQKEIGEIIKKLNSIEKKIF